MTGYIKTVCRIGQGAACCRYLGAGPDGMTCFKLNPELKAHLDLRAMTGGMVAVGDNCEGKANLEDL